MLFRVAIASVTLLLLRDPAAAVVGEDTLPEAHWISAGTNAETGGTSFFRKRFVAPPRLAKAVLLGTCDEKVRIWINAREVAPLAGFDRASTRDVTAQLLPGENLIAVRAENRARLPALRIMLELATDAGRQLWVVSDPSWACFDSEVEGWRSARFDAAQWRPAFAHGPAGIARWGDVFHPTRSPDGYNSWMLASAAPEATHPAIINCPPGFRVELLRSAQPDEGSWIALAFDPRGRITVARERRGLLRFTLGKGSVGNPQLIEDTLLECRGLLYAYGNLYVNANNSKGLYRLRDTDGDDRFDTKELLLQTSGGVGHGRNQIKLGPDGLIYLAHGNDVELPDGFAPGSPFAHFASDQLFPMRWGEHGSSSGVRPPHGHILQTDPEGKNWRIVAGGLRNALDVAFNKDGEMFTYDADNERDIATPWYRPTRVLHVVPGAEYGWRPGAGKFPAYVEDLWPSVVDVGVGSPCGIEFGTSARFPALYREALFIADWAYGRILAVHLGANGASYQGRIEPFISGRPLNVTDLTFGPDGAMYFLTGGRGTQSGLYRVSYAGALDETPRQDATPERQLRRRMEALHSASPSVALQAAWAELGSNDRAVRNAARLVVERQPVAEWEEKGLAEPEPDKALGALLALSRVGGTPERQARLLSRLLALRLETLSADQQLRAARVCALSFARTGRPAPEKSAEVARRFSRLYPAESTALNYELCRLLVYLQAPQIVEKTVPLLSAAKSPEDLLHYLWHLRQVGSGWNLQHRRIAFEALQRAEAHQGARDYLQALRDTRKQFTDALSPDEQAALAGILAPRASSRTQLPIDYAKYQFNKIWRLEDFSAADFAAGGDIARGREAFVAAQCAHCHRVGDDPGGSGGPDLANVGARFGGRDLLGQIVEPSKVVDEKYRAIDVLLSSGGTFFGAVESEDDDKLDLSLGWNAPDVITLRKSEIARRSPSERSLMPDGLVNVLNRQQIRDLLAYLHASRAER